MRSVYSFFQNILIWKFFTLTMAHEASCNCEVRKNIEPLGFLALRLALSNFLGREIVPDKREADL